MFFKCFITHNTFIASYSSSAVSNFVEANRFPEAWSTARTSPLPKISKPIKLNSYRFDSVLPILSKVYGKLKFGWKTNELNGMKSSKATMTLLTIYIFENDPKSKVIPVFCLKRSKLSIFFFFFFWYTTRFYIRPIHSNQSVAFARKALTERWCFL